MRQCPKRLWLDVYAPERRADSEPSLAKFAVGDLVGLLARELYDEEENGILIDVMGDGPDLAIEKTQAALDRRVPIFEAGFQGGGARAFVDILRPSRRGGLRVWDLIEVKSSTSPKQAHRDDIAIQAYVLHEAGVPLGRIKLAHIDTQFIYRGNDQYQGLLREVDLTEEVLSRFDEVAEWIHRGQTIVESTACPEILPGPQCRSPYACGYLESCKAESTGAQYPVEWLPHIQGDLKRFIHDAGIRDMRDVPEERLTAIQRRIRDCTLEERFFIDEVALSSPLSALQYPLCFMDFETVQLAVPIWPGTHPYQTFPFQWSLHIESESGALEHRDYLDLSGQEPSLGFLESLLDSLPATGSILVWNASVEKTVLEQLARRYPVHAKALREVMKRVVDLAAIVEEGFYHPMQKGSYRLKRVLPALAPDLDYGQLSGVRDGYMALIAYVEAIQPDTPRETKEEIERNLRRYCQHDTLALVTIRAQLLASAS